MTKADHDRHKTKWFAFSFLHVCAKRNDIVLRGKSSICMELHKDTNAVLLLMLPNQSISATYDRYIRKRFMGASRGHFT